MGKIHAQVVIGGARTQEHLTGVPESWSFSHQMNGPMKTCDTTLGTCPSMSLTTHTPRSLTMVYPLSALWGMKVLEP